MYTSINDYKYKNPTHRYFIHAMTEHPNTEWMVVFGDPADAGDKFASDKWQVIALSINNYREADKLAQQLEEYPHNLSIGDAVIYYSDRPQAKFFNGKLASVYKIDNGIITVEFSEDNPLLPANKRTNVLPIYLTPAERKHENG